MRPEIPRIEVIEYGGDGKSIASGGTFRAVEYLGRRQTLRRTWEGPERISWSEAFDDGIDRWMTTRSTRDA